MVLSAPQTATLGARVARPRSNSSVNSEAVRRFVRLSAISLSSRLRTGSSCASFFPVRRPLSRSSSHGEVGNYPPPAPRASRLISRSTPYLGTVLDPTGDGRRNPDSRISLGVKQVGNSLFAILLRDSPTRCFRERVWRTGRSSSSGMWRISCGASRRSVRGCVGRACRTPLRRGEPAYPSGATLRGSPGRGWRGVLVPPSDPPQRQRRMPWALDATCG